VPVGEDGGASLPPEGAYDAPDGYENLTRIDQGGFAIVYRGLDTRFDRTVALKILRSDNLNEHQLRRFSAECLATGRVSSHPNIVTVYDAGTTRGHRPWLAMEYCSGGSLAQKVARQGPLPVREVISIGTRLCSALSAAHEAGVLHRDVKPHNVLLTSYGEPALADFGIASVVIAGDTVTETAAYTVVHAAPEILEGRAGTAAADIYSLGSTLYTLLAGQAPFAKEASTGLAPLVSRILRNDLPVIARPGVPAELEQLLRRSMAAQPQDRPASAAELGASLADLGKRLAALETTAGPEPFGGSAVSGPANEEVDEQAHQVTHRGNGASPGCGPRRELQGSGPHSRAAVATFAAPPINAPEAPAPAPVTLSPPPEEPAISARRLLLLLGCAVTVLLAGLTAWGPASHGSQPDQLSPIPMATKTSQHDARYRPQNVVLAQGHNQGELIVSWTMPIRPDVVATVIYDAADSADPADPADSARARAVVNYNPQGVPQATLRGLPRGQRVCLYAVHVVSLQDTITNATGQPMCAVPR
jgi:serine/threonine-protein kinase PknK